jgi:hypothetical protein
MTFRNQLVQLSPNYPATTRPFYAAQLADIAAQAAAGIPTYSQFLAFQNNGTASPSLAIPMDFPPTRGVCYPVATASQPLYSVSALRYAQFAQLNAPIVPNLFLSRFASYAI